ncbi:GNAT family N-acetyltransferase [Massilia sp. Leaf139]|uniref:GNAT family N-acetyltransferase n=1 Tax=Massilia sp. Leaf139 TaxID=1736272 RepID=UPI0006F80263|nr:GNAT family N-acetyltransferase [Massilia sp. Leaf139]KQQ89263.1 acetyltransferase [Massilia sp. Leaf139]
MRIRAVAAGEELMLLAVFQSSVRGLACTYYSPAQIDAWSPPEPDAAFRRQWVERIRANRPWVAEIDGRLAGFADVQPSGYIDQFFVAPEYAGQGVGATLMRQLHAVARGAGASSLFADVSLAAQPFFARWGFAVESEGLPVVRGVALRNARMRKALVASA